MQSERQAGPNSKAGFERPTRKPAGLIAANPSRARARDGGAAAGSLQRGSSGTRRCEEVASAGQTTEANRIALGVDTKYSRSTTSADAGTARP